MITTVIINQSPNQVTIPVYYIGGLITGCICYFGFDWQWLWSVLAGIAWPEFWLGYFGIQRDYF